ncbi:hypothetical protein CO115_05280 [Candidatus Falkowbacteria bacterium CG_4_9_14_3_um_filter_36_9]|uniref:Uncharacterized protein n=1 Tax=Candidatus Falkowbacteria bacterium CG02_land_8_20_14_3_00_36_14 TaxID=1974560 RepID=A0A2M7DN88_9BACT|nr:MAG: hypothetical protein COS18_03105 [Candidatus Falkowbacteria bacterium CG02_land_8_20_14_3_00_36_14]PIX10774.1 MAG: hypothetical protein COZ73_04830 [Candidatus Falkowbacteria bacterium CG_4_8_14_3_um_filter_36_11]PJA10028.1 MAG: hypothetical protein COX67_05620 [Candidatus Falkowbacteria bacterium CG_4_10_14_0_2_um_filter_36_22]PJB17881.1 MAG: hypothetical protein CO115_05280 [Candidatus Falkowbacteria bacterium CG_4_9_14_3_um_filter_36_9]
MKKNNKIISLLVALSLILIITSFIAIQNAQADDNLLKMVQDGGLDSFAGVYDTTPSDIRVVVALMIKIFLGFLGIILTVLMVYAGYIWMVSGGREEEVSKAKNTIRNGVIGLIIIMIAWFVVDYLTDCLWDITTNNIFWMCN